MSVRNRAARGGPRPSRPAPPSAPAAGRSWITPPPLPAALRIFAVLFTTAALLALVSFPLSDPDLWQHLRTGQVIWASHGLPPTNVWTWPGFGEPYVIASWLFRFALWPFYSTGGVVGLFVWRWLTTLVVFGLVWAAARAGRRGGTTGLAALGVLLWCGVLYRLRSQVRPETLVAVLLAFQLWLLESRRAARKREGAAEGALRRVDRAWWLVPLAVVWINVHLSYIVGLLVTGAYLLDEIVRAHRREPGAAPRTLAVVLALGVAGSFLNPYGWGLVRQPLEYFLHERQQLAMRMISELGPVPWGPYLSTGLPLLVALPPLLALWRWRRHSADWAQLAIYAFFIMEGLSTQRFIGYTAVAIAPFFARDVAELAATRRWPSWLARPATRTLLWLAGAALLLVPSLAQRPLWPSIAFRPGSAPVAACDAVASLGIRGRVFNVFSSGGYLLWRFWPERDRLPFIDVHLTGSPEFRDAYARALVDSTAWRRLDDHDRFDWILLPRSGLARGPLLEAVDADTSRWAAVFLDDVAAVFVRRDGADSAVAERARYRWLPAGNRRLQPLAVRMSADSSALAGFIAELERATRESRQVGSFDLMLGNLALARSLDAEALAWYDSARAVSPDLPGLHSRRGRALLATGRAAGALEEFQRARRSESSPAASEALIGRAYRALGRPADARRAWERALKLDPGLPGVRDSLAALDRAAP